MPTTNTQEYQGFLAELGLGSINEAEAYELGLGAGIRTSNTEAGQFATIGQSLGRGTGRAARGLFEAFRGSKGEGKFSFSQGVRNVDDAIVARGAGITGGAAEVQSRRSLRQKIAREDFGDLSQIEARIKVAEFVAKEAMAEGNGTARAAALSKLDRLKREKVEFDKLKATTRREEQRADDEELVSVWLPNEFRSRQAQKINRVNPETGAKEIGVEYFDDKLGKFVFRPIGTYSVVEPDASNARESFDKVWNRTVSPKDDKEIRDQITTGQQTVRKFSRVLDTLTDLEEKGGVEQVVSTPGGILTFLDQSARTVKGVASAFVNTKIDDAPRAATATREGWRGKQAWLDAAKDPDDSVWDLIKLPEGVERASAAAQNFRANIMELAYLAARLAEPSNRGLSDKDIKAALARIAGDSANPQVIIRRFSEMMADSAVDLENKLDVYANVGAPQGYGKADFESFIGGKALPKYRAELDFFKKKHGVTFDPHTGRATFDRLLDADIQPGEGVYPPTEAAPELDDDEFLEAFPPPPQ